MINYLIYYNYFREEFFLIDQYEKVIIVIFFTYISKFILIYIDNKRF